MKKIFFFLCFTINLVFAQNSQMDSLKNVLANTKDDTTKVMLYSKIVLGGSSISPEERLDFGLKGYELAKRTHFEKGQIECGLNTGFILVEKDYFKALSILHEIKPLCEKNKDTINLVKLLGYIAYGYNKFDTERGLNYYRACLALMLKAHISEAIVPIYTAMGYCFKEAGILDSALVYLQKGYQSSLSGVSPIPTSNYPMHYGEIYYKKGDRDLAMSYFRQSIAENKNPDGQSYLGIARIFKDRNQLDSAKIYAKAGYKIFQSESLTIYIIQSAQLLFDLYKDSDPKEALKYLIITTTTKDRLFNQNKARQVEKLYFEEQERQRKIEAEQIAYQNQLKQYSLLAGLGVLLLIAFILYRNNRQKQKANAILQGKNEEIQSTLSKLKSTQAQLIQSEKMASLGELTAGIAHEIQNPLNFVNNFSEVSNELISELKVESSKVESERDKGLEDELLNDIAQNLTKINHHGKRASDIVKGMLEHSRTSTGQKEATDINVLCGDYLRLAYQGQKAKNKDFNATMETHFDPNLPKIGIIPQDIGRVLLNLITNAFYALNERNKQLQRADSPSGVGGKGGQGQVHNYVPKVSITTQLTANSQLLIAVKDNGPGIPSSIKDKIFQPFFTTKPTGQGTGLGLSLSYDIVKAHGGEITLDSNEGVGTEFMIKLPIA